MKECNDWYQIGTAKLGGGMKERNDWYPMDTGPAAKLVESCMAARFGFTCNWGGDWTRISMNKT